MNCSFGSTEFFDLDTGNISMRKLLIFLFAAIVVVSAYSQKESDNLLFVKGETFRNTKSTNYYGKGVTVSNFYIGKYEVTQKEWTAVMGSNPSKFKGDNLPVEMVNWYDCVDYCNKRSAKEGLKPYYNINKNRKDPNNVRDPYFEGELDPVKWTVTINEGANGYRLPTEAEWEFAAGGGQMSKSSTYSGGDDIDKVAWYWRNAGDTYLKGFWQWPVIEGNHCKTKPVGGKDSNELGLYDMSGNVREWCWDWYGDLKSDVTNPQGGSSGSSRVWKGGGWIGGEFCCEPSFRGNLAATGLGPDQGLRVCRGK